MRVRILTNSLVSNDVMAVHAGYLRHRKELLRCGVELYELNEQIKKEQGKRFTWLAGVSKSSLHAKTMAIDGKIMFVGSLNFDQRSLNINNEMGILFREPELAASASKRFDDHIDKVAFRVELVGRGKRQAIAAMEHDRGRQENCPGLRAVCWILEGARRESDADPADLLAAVGRSATA